MSGLLISISRPGALIKIAGIGANIGKRGSYLVVFRFSMV